MRFLADENVPTSVVDYIRLKGHEVDRVVDVLPMGSDDALVAAQAHATKAVVLTWNRTDFQKLIARRAPQSPNRLRDAGLVCFTCTEKSGYARMVAVLDVIEAEHVRAQGMKDSRVIVEVSGEYVKIMR